jgi:hypothetical protein
LAPASVAAAGTFTVPPVTGTVTITLDSTSCAASGTTSVPAFTGTVAVTLTGATVVAVGIFEIAAFGTVDAVLDDVICQADGLKISPNHARRGWPLRAYQAPNLHYPVEGGYWAPLDPLQTPHR